MNTKRCPSCQKALRAETKICSRCGYTFPQLSTNRTGKSRAVSAAPRPASPHRAGHYSGLHPEDQPYQSSMMFVHPSLNAQATTPDSAKQEALSQSAHLPQSRGGTPQYTANTQRTEGIASGFQSVAIQNAEDAVEEDELISAASSPTQVASRPITPPEPLLLSPSAPPNLRPRPRRRGHAVPVTLTIVCIFFLLVGTLFVFLLAHTKPGPSPKIGPLLTAQPNQQLSPGDVLTLSGSSFGASNQISFMHDVKNAAILDGSSKPLQAKADDSGNFSVKITIPGDWEPGQHLLKAKDIEQNFLTSTAISVQSPRTGQPLLQLLNRRLDFGPGQPGTTASRDITLLNAGGSHISWRADSDEPWLSVTPDSGTFTGSTLVGLTANWGNLDPRTYSATVRFSQLDQNLPPLKLAVTMTVQAAAISTLSRLVLSQSTLSYSSVRGQSPANGQQITLTDDGDTPIDWSSTAITGDGNIWLSIDPPTGHLEEHQQAVVKVDVQSQQLPVGQYSGKISFAGSSNPQVSVSLNVIAPGNLAINALALSFQAMQGQNPPAQSLSLTNSGDLPLSWQMNAATTSAPNWLNATTTNGQLDPAATASVQVNVNTASLKVGTYQGTLTFTYGATSKQVAVTLSVSPIPTAAITVQPGTLNFTATQGTNPSPQSFTISNTGNATLNWSIAEDQNGTTYAPASPTSGSLAPAASATITITPNVAQLSAQTIIAALTISDSDAGTSVKSQNVTATIVLSSSSAAVGVSVNNMNFALDTTTPHATQTVSITNTGTAPLNWSVAQTSSPALSWLTVSQTNGTLATGSALSLGITCDSSGVAPGTYTTTLTISDTDPGTSVSSQVINVTITVS